MVTVKKKEKGMHLTNLRFRPKPRGKGGKYGQLSERKKKGASRRDTLDPSFWNLTGYFSRFAKQRIQETQRDVA